MSSYPVQVVLAVRLAIACVIAVLTFVMVPLPVQGSSVVFEYATATTSSSAFATAATTLCYRLPIPLNVATVDSVSFWIRKNTSIVNQPFEIGVLAGNTYTPFTNQIATTSITTTAKFFTATTSPISLSLDSANYLSFCKLGFESGKSYQLLGAGTVYPFITGHTGLGTSTSALTYVSADTYSLAVKLEGSILSLNLSSGTSSGSVLDMASTTEAIYVGFSSLQLYLAVLLLLVFAFLSFRFVSKYI